MNDLKLLPTDLLISLQFPEKISCELFAIENDFDRLYGNWFYFPSIGVVM